jgi:hypothetical protein
VAVCAKQNALLSLDTHPGQTYRPTVVRNGERLRAWIAMMELKRGGMLIEAADATTPSGLFDQLSLDRPPPPGYRFRAAFRASETAFATDVELRGSVLLAFGWRLAPVFG